MINDPTLVLVKEAKEGNKEAWDELIKRFYDEWLDKFHSELGTTLKVRIGETADLVNSGLKDALKDLPSIRNEAVFFTWVSTIVKRKIAAWRRRVRKEKKAELEAANPEMIEEKEKDKLLSYIETLDIIISVFPKYPEEIAAVIWTKLEGQKIQFVSDYLGVSKSTARNRRDEGLDILRKRLES